MEWPEVRRRIREGEGREVEFKLGFDTGKIGPAVCAFANGDGGVVVLGVTDRGRIVGVARDPDTVHERLTTFLGSGFSFPVTARCGRERAPEGWIHWIHVLRQRNPEPLRFGDVAWVRRERMSVCPSPAETQEMNNIFGFVMTEEQIIRPARVEDLDENHFRRHLERQGFGKRRARQPDLLSDYRNFELVSELETEPRPTLFGMLAFGREPQRFSHTHSFLVRCTAYQTPRRNRRVLLSFDAQGRLDEQVRRMLDWAKSFGKREFYDGPVRRDIPLLPLEALREAVVNAVVHRDYAITGSPVLVDVFPDRIEITSPGTLPNRMTVSMVRRGGVTRTRNELMAHYAVSNDLMERRGMGWLAIEDSMAEFNGTVPEIEEDRDGAFVRVTLLREPAGAGAS